MCSLRFCVTRLFYNYKCKYNRALLKNLWKTQWKKNKNSRRSIFLIVSRSDSDGSHFEARTQFHGFFTVTWKDGTHTCRGTREERKEERKRERECVGGTLRLIGQANKFVATYLVDYVRGPRASSVPKLGSYGHGGGEGDTHRRLPYLRHRGPHELPS